MDRLIAAVRQEYAERGSRQAADWRAIALISRAVRDLAEMKAASAETDERGSSSKPKQAVAAKSSAQHDMLR